MIAEPKFKIGQTVWRAGITRTTKEYPCPDCLGERTWWATTGAGERVKVFCPRCHPYHRISDLPSLKYSEVEISINILTVGSVRMDTAAGDGRVYSYMCKETGVGSGNVYYESGHGALYGTEAEAIRAAEVLRAEEQRQVNEQPHALQASTYAYVPLGVALQLEQVDGVWRAFNRARQLRGDIETYLESDKEEYDLDCLREALDDKPWSHPDPLQVLIKNAKALLAESPPSDAAQELWTAIEDITREKEMEVEA